MVLLLGVSLVVQFVFAVFNGVLTGCHRWDYHNAITSGAYVLTATGMIMVLVAGRGLIALAAVTLAGEILTGVLRTWAAYRVCPGLHLSVRLAGWSDAREMVGFGGKSMLAVVSQVILYQTNSLLIMWFLGPAALALYARPAALVRHAGRFVAKFAYVLSPTASALQASTDRDALRNLLVMGTRYALYMALPMILVLTLLGGHILRLWMGDRYDQALVLAVLAIGHVAMFSQETTYQILMGMSRHGLPGTAALIAAVLTVPLAILGLGVLGWGLLGAALALVAPLTVVYAVAVPWYGCRVVGIAYIRYVIRSTFGPILAAIPFGVCLLVARHVWQEDSIRALAVGLGVGGVVLLVVYWRYVFPVSFRAKVTQRARQIASRFSVTQA
jgi:O-antigen/teichoic acid export membrane protein